MLLLETVAVAFSMFSALPMPQFEWNRNNMRYALCAFPLVGVAAGALLVGWQIICQAVPLSQLARAVGFTVIPILVSGGIHLDGYCDSCDALASHAPAEKKLEILADPHIGAFGVIRLAVYLLVFLALCAELPQTAGAVSCLALVQPASRAASGFGVAALNCAKNSGLVHTFANAADRHRVKVVCVVIWAGCSLAMAVCWPFGGTLAAVAVAAAFWRYRAVSYSQFGGITGDLAGWFLQRAQLAALAALYIAAWLQQLV